MVKRKLADSEDEMPGKAKKLRDRINPETESKQPTIFGGGTSGLFGPISSFQANEKSTKTAENLSRKRTSSEDPTPSKRQKISTVTQTSGGISRKRAREAYDERHPSPSSKKQKTASVKNGGSVSHERTPSPLNWSSDTEDSSDTVNNSDAITISDSDSDSDSDLESPIKNHQRISCAEMRTRVGRIQNLRRLLVSELESTEKALESVAYMLERGEER